MTIDRALLDGLARAAVAGGQEVLAVYGTDFAVAAKGDESPVTEADRRAEVVILEHLATLLPGMPVVAEEQASEGRLPADLGRRFVLVDPLDGTKEFISRNGEFTVNIGIVEDGVPVAGAVLLPALGQIYLGARGLGAFAGEVDGESIGTLRPIAVRKPGAGGLVVMASRSHAGPETEALLARLSVAQRISAGSSLKFCRIAEGSADLYPRLGRTMEWDTAASDAVLRAAGGSVVTLDGTPLAYGKRRQAEDSDFANPWFLAAGAIDLGAVVAAASR
ncbi:3'(2'),5'-bisphosphate nucleotidase CysQ [Prosthecomicrobium sp. N25]|uniref:3'(2'),5'-bisphosphate nucleotidase CysQ n=1 Tax=Prosthecomicrobium sp. N25 TaxID=3129254 RepID=UPI003077BA12